MTLGSHLKRSIVIEHATEIAQTTTVCSQINGRPLLVPPFFAIGHNVSLQYIKKKKRKNRRRCLANLKRDFRLQIKEDVRCVARKGERRR